MEGDLEAPLLSAHQPSKYEVANALFGLSLVAATVFAEANLLIGQYWRLPSRFYFAMSLSFSASVAPTNSGAPMAPSSAEVIETIVATYSDMRSSRLS